MRRILIASAVIAAALIGMRAEAAEVRVLISGAFKSPMSEIKPLFEQASGHRLMVEDDTSPRIARRVADGEAVDLIISSSGGIDDLIKNRHVVADSKAPLARSGFGVMVRKGAAKPDISTTETFRQALLAAKSVAYTNPASGGQSGVHFAKVLVQLGIADEVNRKAKLGDAEPIAVIVGRGDAEIGVHPIPEILARADVADFVGPLPGPLQSYNNLSVGIPAKAKEPDAARAFLEFLKGSAAQGVIKAKGLEPG